MLKKKKQHFVSQFYLRNWAETNEKIFTNVGTSVRPMGTSEVAAENYFYRVKSLSKSELNLLEKENGALPDIEIRRLIKNIINFSFLFGIEEKFQLTDAEVVNLETRQANLVEEYYCILEDCVLGAYNKILNSSQSELTLEEYNYIVRFMFSQLTRTQKAKASIKGEISDLLHAHAIRFEAYHTISSLILAERMSLAAVNMLSTITVLENSTGLQYITNDCPVFNLKSVGDKHIQLYWPISPTKAIILEDSVLSVEAQQKIKATALQGKPVGAYFIKPSERVDRVRVEQLNQKMWDNKNRNAFSAAPDELSIYLS